MPDRVIPFQFNPDSLVRSLRRRGTRDDSGPTDAHRIHGAPTETITMTVELDAADAFAGQRFPDLAGQLAELELLLYPSSATVAGNDDRLARGTIEILAEEAPLLVLTWGSRRYLPVRLDSLQITEQAFDPWLCPVRATVELGLQVLSYHDLLVGDPGRGLFHQHHERLETTRDNPQTVPPDHTGTRQQAGSAP
jgi:hypothetical protein